MVIISLQYGVLLFGCDDEMLSTLGVMSFGTARCEHFGSLVRNHTSLRSFTFWQWTINIPVDAYDAITLEHTE